MAVCRRCGNQMSDAAAACPACGELRYQPPQQAAAPQYSAPAPSPAQYPQAAAPQYAQPQAYAPQPQQAAYGAPPAAASPGFAMPAMPAVSADEAKGFIGALFDLSFTSFITTKLIKVLYILAIVGGALEALSLIGAGFLRGSIIGGLIMLVLSPLVFLAFVIFARVYMEIIIVIFRGAEHLETIAKNIKR